MLRRFIRCQGSFKAPQACAAVGLAFCGALSMGQNLLPNTLPVDSDGTVHVPAQAVPVSTFLSPEAKSYLAEHLQKVREPEMVSQNGGVPPLIAGYLDRQRILFAVDRKETEVGGVHAFVYTPKEGVALRNRRRVLIELHGGGFTGCWPGCAELESIPITALGRIRVVAVDYREAPQFKFPAASEDVAAVYRELLKTYPAANIGIYGCSAGGMLTGEAVAWFQRHGLPRPGAVGILCAGLTSPEHGFGGDADFMATAMGEARTQALSPMKPSERGETGASPMRYFDGVDFADPVVSPVASPEVLSKFPSSLIVSGTRGFELSSAVYSHTQLVKSGAQSELHVWEGLFHGFFYNPDVPESRDCYDVIVRFFDRQLGRR